MSRIVTYSAITAGAVANPAVWNSDCASYRINDQQGVRARWGLMTGCIDPRWPFANADGSIETQGPAGSLSQSMSATSESGINGPDAQVRFGKVTDPDDASKAALYLHRKQGDEATLKRTEMSFSPTFTPVPLAATCWIACSMRIPAAWAAASAGDETMVFQVHETPDGGDDTQPAPIGMLVKGTGMLAWVRSNPNAVTLEAATTYTQVWSEATYPTDQWQHWVFKLRSHWDSAQAPRFEAWRALGDSGALVKLIDYGGPNSYNNTSRDYAKHGLYYYDDEWSGGLTSRTMHSKGLYQWLDGQGIDESMILEHLRSV